MKVLFAEPNDLIRKVLTKRLSDEGYEVLSVANGLEAEKQLKKQQNISIFVTEELLPFKSGFELLKICNEQDLPSIVISDADLEEKIVEAFSLGASDFIDKPYSPSELIVRIKNILKHSK